MTHMRKKFETPRGYDCRDMNTRKSARTNDRGFSLLELCLVVAILLIVAAMIFINAVSAIQNIRLHQSAVSYANLLQQARIKAVTDDTFYTVQTGTDAASNPIAFVDLSSAKTGAYAAGDPMMVFSQNVTYMATSSGPGRTDLISKFLPTGQAPTVDLDNGPTFGPRGLPCKPTGSICPYISAGVATSYITFLQNVQSTKWEAVTVSPAGRTRVWSYDGTTWSAMN
jgi:prepilin-type N-terminal cleavage/methylation domain-containing protein